MMILALALLVAPFCATIAGLVVWASSRNELLDDGELLRNFLFILVIGIALVWAVSRTDTMRMRLDPQFRIQTELDAHPVYSTIKRFAPDDTKLLEEFLASQLSRGATLSEAFLEARPLLTDLTTHRLGFADQQSHVMWGRLVADSLKELQARDPLLCYRVLSAQTLDQQTLTQAFSADNTKAFQQAVADIYESADRGMRHEQSPTDRPVEFNEAALEFRVVQEAVEQRFGHAVERQVARKEFPESPTAPPEQMCAARIFQLEAMLKRPKPMASRLIDSVLR